MSRFGILEPSANFKPGVHLRKNPGFPTDPPYPKNGPKVRVQLSSSMTGADGSTSHKAGSSILCSEQEAAMHVRNGNGKIIEGPGEQDELEKLRTENALMRAALAKGEDKKK